MTRRVDPQLIHEARRAASATPYRVGDAALGATVQRAVALELDRYDLLASFLGASTHVD
jgi:hypothetical protein